jgi:hypothetical protein
MSYLMHIGFDNSSRLWKDVYYFRYTGVSYKLIQNNIRKYCDVLLTIISDHHDNKAINFAYTNASEYLSALSWQNNSLIKVQHLGGCGYRKKLRNAKCMMFNFPEVPFQGFAVGYDINSIPEIENEKQRDALTLFREASNSNNDYLSFIFFWQVIEVGNNDAIGWINKTWRRNSQKLRISTEDIARLPLAGRQIGNYLYDDCRNAIAHINRRKVGKLKISLDKPEDISRIALSTSIIKEFARFYIKDKLKLMKKMWLVRKGQRGFPTYVKEELLRTANFTIAYESPRPALGTLKKKRWH